MKLKKILEEISPESLRKVGSKDFITMSKEPKFKSSFNTSQPSEGKKPVGTWFGIGKSWINWVKYNMPSWEGDYLWKLELHLGKLVILKNSSDREKFENEFAIHPGSINWREVQQSGKSGIIIYDNALTGGMNWTAIWDIPSGCIWSSTTLKKTEQL